jgi:aspartate kinase
MKFGGNCVDGETNQAHTAQRIVEARERGLSPVVVVSAMGRGGPYSTAGLEKFIRGIGPKIEPRERDLVMSCGEIIATVAMAHLLKTMGEKSVALTGGQAGLITDLYYGNAQVVDVRREGLLQWLDEGHIVFVTGFQGITPNHDITTLGEGGSDYTAVALAFTLQQPRTGLLEESIELDPVHIYKEVDGVMTANPDNFDDQENVRPKLLLSLTYDEMVDMSKLGAQVMQHKAALMARRHGLAVLIKNFATDAEGTEISGDTEGRALREVTGVADVGNLFVFTVPRTTARLAAQLSEDLQRDRLAHWEIASDPDKILFAVRREKYRDVGLVIGHILFDRDLKAEISEQQWGLVSLVGQGMQGRSREVGERAHQVLQRAQVQVAGAIEGEISVSYLMKEADRKKAVRILHGEFIT